MDNLTLLPIAVFVLKLSAWCIAPFGLAFLLRRRSAAERHAVVIVTLAGALALPLAHAWVPRVGPGWFAASPISVSQPAPPEPALVAPHLWEGPHSETTRPSETNPTPGVAPHVGTEPVVGVKADLGSRSGDGTESARSEPIGDTGSTERRQRRDWTTSSSVPGAEVDARPAGSGRTLPLPPPLPWSLLVVWSLGTAVALAQLALRFLKLRGILARAHPIHGTTPGELERLSAALEISHPPALYASSEVSIPIAIDPAPTAGGRSARRAIVLPTEWPEWDAHGLRIALLHELAHLKRGDGWSTLGAALVVALYWWHPAVSALARWARREAERAADDLVLAQGEPPSTYADRLLLFARNLSPQPHFGVPLMNIRRSDLKHRVLAILDPDRRRRPLDRRLQLIGGVLMLLLLGPLAGLRLVSESQASVGGDTLGHLALFPGMSFDSSSEVSRGPAKPPPARREPSGVEAPIEIAQNDPDYDHDWSEHGTHGDSHKNKEDTASSRAHELYDEHRFAEAAEAFAATGDAGERAATSYYNAACSAALAGNTDGALGYLQRSVDAGWDDAEHVVEDSDLDSLRADARFQAIVDALYEARGELRPPIEGYRLRSITERYDYLVETSSDDGKAWYKNGTALLSLRQLDRAETALERAVDLLGPKGDSALYNLACLHAIAGDAAAANQTLRRAVEAGLDDVEHMQRDVDLESIRGTSGFADAVRLAEALDLDRFRDWNYDDHDHGSKGHRKGAEYDRGRWNEAIDFYRTWTAENPDIGRGWYNLGWALHHARHFDEAVAPFERAAETGYSPANSAYNIACGHAMSGSVDEAFRWLDEAVARGYQSAHHLEHDDDLANLHSDPRFRKLIWSLEDRSK